MTDQDKPIHTEPGKPHLIAVPAGDVAYIYPIPAITDQPDDDGAQIITEAIALGHVRDTLDEGEDG